MADDIFRHPIGKIFLFCIRAHIFKRQNGNRGRCASLNGFDCRRRWRDLARRQPANGNVKRVHVGILNLLRPNILKAQIHFLANKVMNTF